MASHPGGDDFPWQTPSTRMNTGLNLSFTDLLQSTEAGMFEDEEILGSTGRGRGLAALQVLQERMPPARGQVGAIDDGDCRGPMCGTGRGAVRGGGHGAGRPPVAHSSLPYRTRRSSQDATATPRSDGVHGGFQDPNASNWSQNYEEEGEDVHGQDALSEDGNFDKAEWTNTENTAAFCTLCVEEITAGNRSNGFMTGRGYKNIAVKFEQMRGLRHSKMQLKNRWEGLKRFYSFWLWLNKQTGLGRSPNGGIVATDTFWKTHTKGHAEWRKLKNGPPDNLNELEIMFEHTVVDGSTACTPGHDLDDEGDAGEEGQEGEIDGSPMTGGNLKRGLNNNRVFLVQ